MKATTIILAAVLIFTANVLFAGNDISSRPVLNTNSTMKIAALAPELPAEADFSDAFLFDYSALAPLTPTEASFDDMNVETVMALGLAPVNPATADLEETTAYNSLAPVLPAEADFE